MEQRLIGKRFYWNEALGWFAGYLFENVGGEPGLNDIMIKKQGKIMSFEKL